MTIKSLKKKFILYTIILSATLFSVLFTLSNYTYKNRVNQKYNVSINIFIDKVFDEQIVVKNLTILKNKYPNSDFDPRTFEFKLRFNLLSANNRDIFIKLNNERFDENINKFNNYLNKVFETSLDEIISQTFRDLYLQINTIDKSNTTSLADIKKNFYLLDKDLKCSINYMALNFIIKDMTKYGSNINFINEIIAKNKQVYVCSLVNNIYSLSLLKNEKLNNYFSTTMVTNYENIIEKIKISNKNVIYKYIVLLILSLFFSYLILTFLSKNNFLNIKRILK
jgi:hypothetical protein